MNLPDPKWDINSATSNQSYTELTTFINASIVTAFTAFWQILGPNHCYSNCISLLANSHAIPWICMDSARALRSVHAHMQNSQMRGAGGKRGARAIDPTQRHLRAGAKILTSSSCRREDDIVRRRHLRAFV